MDVFKRELIAKIYIERYIEIFFFPDEVVSSHDTHKAIRSFWKLYDVEQACPTRGPRRL